jgi:hypothetical protein
MQQIPHAVLAAAFIYCRNITLSPEKDRRKEVNEIMEAIHEVPDFLKSWQLHDLKELRLHLSCFDSTKWVGSPNLLKIFDAKLQELEGATAK